MSTDSIAPMAPIANDDDWDDAPVVERSRRFEDAEMDITPMIDVTFLLLIFFMVTSTLDQQARVDLAVARNGQGVVERDSVIITVGAGGLDAAPVYLSDNTSENQLPDDLAVQGELIREAIRKAQRDQQKHRVLIMADRNVAHRDVSRVIKAASQVEGVSIHLAVHEEK